MDQQGALQIMNMRVQLAHPKPQAGSQQQESGFGGASKTERVPHPTLKRDISEDKYIYNQFIEKTLQQ